MWGQNRPASKGQRNPSILWLLRPQTPRFRQLGTQRAKKEPQAPEGGHCDWGLGGGARFVEADPI
jgi:hypothetical protein